MQGCIVAERAIVFRPPAQDSDVRSTLRAWALQLNTYVLSWFTEVSANYTVQLSDRIILVSTGTGAVTLTLPLAASAPGLPITIKKVDASANNMIIDGNGAETIDGAANITTNVQWAAYTLVSTGTAWRVL